MLRLCPVTGHFMQEDETATDPLDNSIVGATADDTIATKEMDVTTDLDSTEMSEVPTNNGSFELSMFTFNSILVVALLISLIPHCRYPSGCQFVIVILFPINRSCRHYKR